MVLIGSNTIAIIFGAGVLYQRVKGLDKRLERVENLLNGHLYRLGDHDAF